MNMFEFETEHFSFVNYTLLSEEQSYKIWEGRNHPDVRKWMAHQEPFSFEKHQQYVETLKNRTDRIYWAVLKDNIIVGSLALNPYFPLKKEGETGMFILPSYIGCGLGFLIKKEFLYFLFSNKLMDRIYAKTKIENIRNQKLNIKLGFRIYAKDTEYIYMEILNK